MAGRPERDERDEGRRAGEREIMGVEAHVGKKVVRRKDQGGEKGGGVCEEKDKRRRRTRTEE